MTMSVSETCRATGVQACHCCDDFECGDNTNYRERLSVRTDQLEMEVARLEAENRRLKVCGNCDHIAFVSSIVLGNYPVCDFHNRKTKLTQTCESWEMIQDVLFGDD